MKGCLRISVLLIIFLPIAACVSLPEIPSDMPPSVILKNGQSQLSMSRWNQALHYYETYLERFPDDPAETVQVEYEIAFIYYTSDRKETAKSMFQAIIQRYETESLPRWPKTLSEKLLASIQEEEEAEEGETKKEQ